MVAEERFKDNSVIQVPSMMKGMDTSNGLEQVELASGGFKVFISCLYDVSELMREQHLSEDEQ